MKIFLCKITSDLLKTESNIPFGLFEIICKWFSVSITFSWTKSYWLTKYFFLRFWNCLYSFMSYFYSFINKYARNGTIFKKRLLFFRLQFKKVYQIHIEIHELSQHLLANSIVWRSVFSYETFIEAFVQQNIISKTL